MNSPFRFVQHPAAPSHPAAPAGPRPQIASLPVHPSYPCAAEIQQVPPMIQAFVMARIADIAAALHISSLGYGALPSLSQGAITEPWGGKGADKIIKEAGDTISFLTPYYPKLANCFASWCASIGIVIPVQTFNPLAPNGQAWIQTPNGQADLTVAPVGAPPSAPMRGPRPLIPR